jgi:flagellar basal-body rod modification protein FlgD
MDISAINSEIAPSKSKTALSGLASDFNNFVTMLTVQLKNQDPTAPLDSNQFTQQLVAFTGVEQAVTTNAHLEKLVNMQQHSQLNDYVGYIGKEVEIDTGTAYLVNHKAKFKFTVPEETGSVKAVIYDAHGAIVTEEIINDFNIGLNELLWNGQDYNGAERKSGNYHLKISARDKEGKEIRSVTAMKGLVTGITLNEGVPHLIVDNEEVRTDNIISVNIQKS